MSGSFIGEHIHDLILTSSITGAELETILATPRNLGAFTLLSRNSQFDNLVKRADSVSIMLDSPTAFPLLMEGSGEAVAASLPATVAIAANTTSLLQVLNTPALYDLWWDVPANRANLQAQRNAVGSKLKYIFYDAGSYVSDDSDALNLFFWHPSAQAGIADFVVVAIGDGAPGQSGATSVGGYGGGGGSGWVKYGELPDSFQVSMGFHVNDGGLGEEINEAQWYGGAFDRIFGIDATNQFGKTIGSSGTVTEMDFEAAVWQREDALISGGNGGNGASSGGNGSDGVAATAGGGAVAGTGGLGGAGATSDSGTGGSIGPSGGGGGGHTTAGGSTGVKVAGANATGIGAGGGGCAGASTPSQQGFANDGGISIYAVIY